MTGTDTPRPVRHTMTPAQLTDHLAANITAGGHGIDRLPGGRDRDTIHDNDHYLCEYPGTPSPLTHTAADHEQAGGAA